MEKLLLRMNEAAEMLAISRTKCYELAEAGQLPGLIRLGKSLRVSLKALEEHIEREAAGASGEGQPAALTGREGRK